MSTHNLRFRGHLKCVKIGEVDYCELPYSLSVGYDYTDENSANLPLPDKFTQAPTGVSIIGRVMHLVQENDPQTVRPRTKIKAAHIAASELRIFWVFGMTVPPIAELNAAKKIVKIYEEFQSLNKYPKEKRGPAWIAKAENFNNRMLTGLNLATSDKLAMKRVEEEFEIQMKRDDLLLVEDNCKIKTCKCSRNSVGNCKNCPRQMFITSDVDSAWFKWRLRKRKDEEAAAKAVVKTTAESQEAQKKVHVDTLNLSDDPSDITAAEVLPDIEVSDVAGSLSSSRKLPPRSCTVSDSRSKSYCNCVCARCDCSCHGQKPAFPQVPLRFSRNELNPQIMRAVAHVQATYKISDNDTRGIFVDVGNLVFGQEWKKEVVFDNTDAEVESDQEDMDDWIPVDTILDNNSNFQVPSTSHHAAENLDTTRDNQEVTKKKRKVQKDLSKTFPSRATLRRWMESASLLNLRHVAKILMDHDSVTTIGFDDTTKAAGHKLFDSKALNITVDGDGRHRKSYTTGFHSNLSHSGEDQTQSLKFALEQMAVLAGTGLEELIEQVDFWMTDRSGDGDIVMENLGIDDQKILKCNAHVILCIDKCIDSIFLEVESSIGRDKLIGINIGSMAFTSSESIITLGLMALAKLLSPSHAALSYSLYESYKMWMEREGLDNSKFYGFSQNRFGRTAALASIFLEHKENLNKFFAEVVDENSNKLVLAVATYIESDWFSTGCMVYNMFRSQLIQPLCSLLGIDEKMENMQEEKSWTKVKDFFVTKQAWLTKIVQESQTGSPADRLRSKCAEKISEGLTRQLDKVGIFRDEFTAETIEKLKHAPLTNSGCESRQAQLDVRVRYTGGSAPLQTLSNKQTVAVNAYLMSTDFDDLDTAGDLFKWARTADEALKVRKMQKEFNAKVELVKFSALRKKEMLKKKRFERSLKLHSVCRSHGGPITAENLEDLDKLEYKQLVAEVSYIKATVGKEIKMKKRVTDPVTKRFKMNPLPAETLKISIKNVLKPENESGSYSLSSLLSQYFQSDS